MSILSVVLSIAGAVAPASATEAVPLSAAQPPIRLWMSNDRRFREGELVRVQVDAEADGYLLVLNYAADGRLQVLFPLDPRDDARVQAGRRYEVRDDEGRGAFRAGGDGTGLIYSAIARDPWRFEEIVYEGRWDNSRLSLDRRSDNPESEITELVQRLSGPDGFDYDVMGYRVYGAVATTTYGYGDYGRGPVYLYDDYLFCNDWYWRFDGCRRWPFDGGWSVGLGFYGGYYPYSYYPYSYGYWPYRYYGYTPFVPILPGNRGRGPILTGRPRRTYIGNPRPPASPSFGNGGFGRSPRRPAGVGSPPPIDWRPRGGARPVGTREPGISRGSGPNGWYPPAARPARPGGNWSGPPRGHESGGSPRGGNPHGSGSGGGGGGRASGGGGHGSPPVFSRPRRP